MLQPTAIIKVLCRADKLEETVNLLAWAVGHRVELEEQGTFSQTRYLFIHTDLAYADDSNTILERLGLDIIGKIAGVLSWTVIPSDIHDVANTEGTQPAEHIDPRDASLEEQLTEVLGMLPIPISIIRRSSGTYAWKWQAATGHADTFLSAVTAALALAMTSFVAIRGELGSEPADAANACRAPEDLEVELTNRLLALPLAVSIVQPGGEYTWKWHEATGKADTFVAALAAALTQAMRSYIMVRRDLMGS